MQLIVLGKSADDKGKQLEVLTGDIFASLGYQDIVLNKMGDAGELDVTAKFSLEIPGGRHVEQVIGECKALKEPLNTPDWLKFLGKLFIERLTRPSTYGCLVALSGVNGVVHNSYDNLKDKDRVRLIGSPELLAFLKMRCGLCSEKELLAFISTAGIPHSQYMVAYYERQTYWIVTFTEGRYTVLPAKPDHITVIPDAIREMVAAQIESPTFLDLKDAVDRKKMVLVNLKLALSFVLMNDKPASRTEIDAYCASRIAKDQPNDPSVLNEALEMLVGENVFAVDGDVYRFSESLDENVPLRAGVLNVLIKDVFIMDAVGTPQWDRLLDDKLLDHIVAIHRPVTLNDEQRKHALQAIQMSPSALRHGLNPDPMLQTHADLPMPDEQKEIIVEHDRNHFLRQIYGGVQRDFGTPEMRDILYERLKITELTRDSRIQVKSKDGAVMINDVVEERWIIGEYEVPHPDGRPQYVLMSGLKEKSLKPSRC